MALRVAVDTNVIISALHRPGGTPSRIVDLGLRREVELFVSTAILEELARILLGPKFRWTEVRVREAVKILPATVLDPEPHLHVLDDEPDNRVLECAQAARAEYLVTGDRHLLALEGFEGTSILTPRAFLEELRERG